MRVALVQMTSSDDPAQNLEQVRAYVAEAALAGAEFVLTPEVTNCVSASRSHQAEVLAHEADDLVLAGLRDTARGHKIWLLAGSLALKTDDVDGRFANRSFLIDPEGDVRARYDKIHMFDVQVSAQETYRESAGYRPGDQAVVTIVGNTPLGMTICYDLRFPGLFRALAQAGARIISVPSAFSPVTGAAHWESLLRARAIECGAFILAPAQTGTHPAQTGRQRQTYGHSLIVDPWGRVLADGGEKPGLSLVDLDLEEVDRARGRISSLLHDRNFESP